MFGIFKLWVDKYDKDFEETEGLLSLLEDFVQSNSSSVKGAAEQVLKIIKQKVKFSFDSTHLTRKNLLRKRRILLFLVNHQLLTCYRTGNTRNRIRVSGTELKESSYLCRDNFASQQQGLVDYHPVEIARQVGHVRLN